MLVFFFNFNLCVTVKLWCLLRAGKQCRHFCIKFSTHYYDVALQFSSIKHQSLTPCFMCFIIFMSILPPVH